MLWAVLAPDLSRSMLSHVLSLAAEASLPQRIFQLSCVPRSPSFCCQSAWFLAQRLRRKSLPQCWLSMS